MGLFDSLFTWSCMGRVVGCLASLVLLIGGALTFILGIVKPTCIITGVYMICLGVVVGLLEAPLVWSCIQRLQSLSERLAKVTHMQRAVLYACSSLLMFLCIGASSILSFVLLLGTAFLYMMAFLGPRGGDRRSAPASPRRDVELGEDEQELIVDDGAPNAAGQDEESYPWDKFMDNVATKVGEQVAAAAVTKLTGDIAAATGGSPSASGTSAAQGSVSSPAVLPTESTA
eukprot:m.52206 g.52206  ORF g.52206 m.52206 type:complete len:230 (-) comp12271_c0_seq1:89-778(-)